MLVLFGGNAIEDKNNWNALFAGSAYHKQIPRIYIIPMTRYYVQVTKKYCKSRNPRRRLNLDVDCCILIVITFVKN